MYDVVVVGGGISGLATAYYLLKFAKKKVKILLLERENRVGGKMSTVKEKGFIIEEGPNGFLDNRPYTLQLVEELGIKDSLIRASSCAAKRYIYTKGALHEVPLSPVRFFFSSLLSCSGKLRLFSEPLVSPGFHFKDESLSEFAKRRLGEEALEVLIDPMVAGVYAGNPDHVSVRSTFPTIYHLEQKFGSLVKGMIGLSIEGKRKGGPAGPGGTLTSFKDGVNDLIDTLYVNLKEIVKLKAPVYRVFRTKKGYEVITQKGILFTKTLILATPSYVAARIISTLDKGASFLLSQIPYAPISVVALAYKTEDMPHTLDGFGFLVPRKEKMKILGCLWDSFIFPNRAPEGYVLLRVMIGGDRQPSLALKSYEELIQIAKEDLKIIMEIESAPFLVKVFKHEKGIPQYTIGHDQRLIELEDRLKMYEGVFLNSNAYRGIGLNDCIANSLFTAQKVTELL